MGPLVACATVFPPGFLLVVLAMFAVFAWLSTAALIRIARLIWPEHELRDHNLGSGA